MKKIICIFTLLLSTFVLTSNVSATSKVYVNSNGISMTVTQKNNLLNLGFTEENIEYMEQSAFDSNKDLIGNVVSSETKFYKVIYYYGYVQNYFVNGSSNMNRLNANNYLSVENLNKETIQSLLDTGTLEIKRTISEEITEEEFNSLEESLGFVGSGGYQINANPDIYETSGKRITTTISYVSSTNRYRFKNDLYWKTMPSTRSWELFGIKGNNAVTEPLSGSQYASTTYTMKETCNNTSSTTTVNQTTPTGNWKRSAHGYGVTFELPKNSTGAKYWDPLTGSYPCNWSNPLPPPNTSPVYYNINLTALSHTMYFDVVKIGVTSPISAYGSFQHAVKTISLSTSLGFTIGTSSNLGLVFTVQTTSNYDGMGGTHAQVLNPVW